MNTYTMEGKQVIKQFATQLKQQLQKQMKTGGSVAAIKVCSQMAPQLSSQFSRQTGWMVKRVSLKTRNPIDIPDAWERKILKQFDIAAASGKPTNQLMHSEILTEGNQKYFRLMKAIPTAQICLACHDNQDKLNPKIQKQLSDSKELS